MRAVNALLNGDAAECLSILDAGPVGEGPAVHVEVDDDVVVTLLPDECGVAVLRAEALDRLGRRGSVSRHRLESARATRGCRQAGRYAPGGWAGEKAVCLH